MPKHYNKRGEQRNSLSRRVTALEREERKEHATLPPRPEDVVARQAMKGERPDFLRVTRGNASYRGPVDEHLARVGGRSTSGQVPDKERGASSPIPGRKRK